jgi:hypothetical protein
MMELRLVDDDGDSVEPGEVAALHSRSRLIDLVARSDRACRPDSHALDAGLSPGTRGRRNL